MLCSFLLQPHPAMCRPRIYPSILLLISLLTGCTQPPLPTPEEQVHAWWVEHLDQLLVASGRLDSLLKYPAEEASVQAAFRDARLAYKPLEPLLEHYNPELAKKLNGPAIDKHDLEAAERKVWPATGFQVVEEYLFPAVDLDQQAEASKQMSILHGHLQVYRQDADGLSLSDRNIFEALRLEPLRIMSLGISGFDSPVAFHSLPEARAALDGMRDILALYASSSPGKVGESLIKEIAQAQAFLDKNTSFDDFDRLTFIKEHLDVISRELYAFQQKLGILSNPWPTAVDLNEPSFLSEKTFNPEFFAPKFNRNASSEVIALGKTLFSEPMLSSNSRRSCASCHHPDKAFTDGLKKSKALNGHDDIPRNTPTVINAAFQRSQFYDSRINFLEGQVGDVVSNSDEMHGSVEEAAAKLSVSPEYRRLFAQAFDQDSITAPDLQKAIAAYVRSLNGFNAPLDQYLRGDEVALTEGQVSGFNLYMGKGKCATCHFMPLFNGTVPPMYNDTESEVLGVPAQNDTINAQVDPDEGMFVEYGGEMLRFAFKTPTLRNVALTAPYMHNGVYETLEEVIDFYNRGGGAGIGIDLAYQTLPPDPLNLTEQEQKDLVSFLHALTDTTGLTAVPRRIVIPEEVALQQE